MRRQDRGLFHRWAGNFEIKISAADFRRENPLYCSHTRRNSVPSDGENFPAADFRRGNPLYWSHVFSAGDGNPLSAAEIRAIVTVA